MQIIFYRLEVYVYLFSYVISAIFCVLRFGPWYPPIIVDVYTHSNRFGPGRVDSGWAAVSYLEQDFGVVELRRSEMVEKHADDYDIII